jgi:hypothetical protein
MALGFQALTLRSRGRLDRIITDVEVTPSYDSTDPPSPLPTRLPTKALWDTGASKSVLSEAFVKGLGLSPVGSTQVHHGDGTSTRNTYLVDFYLPNGVGVLGILATEFPASHTQFAVLIGMDVMSLGDLSITNVGGQTCMSFRTPSCECVDFVQQANRLKYAGVGRNDLCPCASGKKFKKCHGE